MKTMKQDANSVATERAVLGALLLRPDAYYDLDLSTEEFATAECRRGFAAMTDLVFEGQPLDPLAVACKLGCEVAAVEQWKRFAADPARLTWYSERVRERATGEQVRNAAREVLASEAAGSDLLAFSQQRFMELGKRAAVGDAVSAGPVARDVVNEAEARRAGRLPKVLQARCGVPVVDNLITLARGGVITYAGRPSMGKSAAAIWTLLRFLEQRERVLLFSTESSKEEVVQRILSTLSGISSRRIAMGRLDDVEMARLRMAREYLDSLYLWVDDAHTDVAHATREIRRLKARDGLTMVCVDHLQEMRSRSRRVRDQRSELEDVLLTLRDVCREEPRSTLFLLSQLNRMVDSRDDHRPALSDLKESGKIEEVSDVVVLVYRPSYYSREADAKEVLFAVAKNRNGPIGRIEGRWNDQLGILDGVYDEFQRLWTVDMEKGLVRDGQPIIQADPRFPDA